MEWNKSIQGGVLIEYCNKEDGSGRLKDGSGRLEDGSGRQEDRSGRQEDRSGRQEDRSGPGTYYRSGA